MTIIAMMFKDKRFRKVLLMFLKFAVQLWWINKKKRFLSKKRYQKKIKAIYQKQAHVYTETATELGGLLIKLGQFFSIRADVLPEEYTKGLSKLQDAVKPVKTKDIIKRIETEYDRPINEVYTNFSEEPVASASLGQVHTADIEGHTRVAVKVLRPGIEQIIQTDFNVLQFMVKFAKRYPKITASVDLDKIYDEFVETTLDELDFIKEGHYADEFKANFSEDPRIYVPEVYWEYTTKHVLTMEYIDGYKLNDYLSLEMAGIDRVKLANTIISVYVQQILTDSFFHADPHPGNLIVKDDGTIVFIDFGMMGRIQEDMRENLIAFAIAFYKKDTNEMVIVFEKLGFIRPNADKQFLIKGLNIILGELFADSNLKNINLDEFFLEFREFMYSMPFQIPAKTLYLGKSAITIMEISRGLNPEIDFIKTLTPYGKKLLAGEESGVTDTLKLLLEEAKKILTETIGLPGKLNKLINGLETGEIRIHPSRSFEQTLLKSQKDQTNRITRSIFSSGFLISGVILLDGTYSTAGLSLIILSGLTFVTLLKRNSGFIGRKRSERTTGTNGTSSEFRRPPFHP